MSLHEYLRHFRIKTKDKKQTHLSFIGGQYNIPNVKLEAFYKVYYNAVMLQNIKVHLVEKVHGNIFKFFLDIDDCVNFDEILDEFTMILGNEYIITKNTQKENYHVHFYNIICNYEKAIDIINKTNCIDKIDVSVYKTGLRMLGAFKNKHTLATYKIWNHTRKIFIRNPTFQDFLKTIVVHVFDTNANVDANNNVLPRACIKQGSVQDLKQGLCQECVQDLTQFRLNKVSCHLINLKRIKAGYCELCKRVHDNENAYMTSTDENTWEYHCFRYGNQNNTNSTN